MKHSFKSEDDVNNRLRVGNLGFAIDVVRLKEIFSECGSVSGAKVAESPFSGASRGFGFVEMSTEQEAAACILQLNGKEVDGRVLTVAEAQPEKTARRVLRRASR
jgi:RNA recognition motif-containing protein